jgi:molecular chaperone DnaK
VRDEPRPSAHTQSVRRPSAILGIDLGTSHASVSVWENGAPIIIAGSKSAQRLSSVVTITKNGEYIFGTDLQRRTTDYKSAPPMYGVIRLLGRSYAEVSNDAQSIGCEIVRAPNGDARLSVNGKEYSPPEIAAVVLMQLAKAAAERLGVRITKAVISVPGHFNDTQRQATRHAGTIAGLEVVRLVNAPTAAACLYGVGAPKDETIAVYDFGGGKFDISIILVGDGVVEVAATAGDTHLGGIDLDRRIIDWTIAEFKRVEGIDLSKDANAFRRIRQAAENAKIELSSITNSQILLPFITADPAGPKHLNVTLTRTTLEELVEPLLQKTVDLTKQALADAGLQPSNIDRILLFGGTTHMPRVPTIVKALFGKAPERWADADEAIARGAAVQAAVFSKDVEDLLVLDVVPMSLGIETLGGVMTTLIPRNTTIPTLKTEVFSTASDNQTSVEIHVLQGERPLARDNHSLGRFHLVGIPAAKRAVPQIEVTFDVDANGIVNVHAKDLGTGKEQKVTITGSGGLSADEVWQLVREAEARN